MHFHLLQIFANILVCYLKYSGKICVNGSWKCYMYPFSSMYNKVVWIYLKRRDWNYIAVYKVSNYDTRWSPGSTNRQWAPVIILYVCYHLIFSGPHVSTSYYYDLWFSNYMYTIVWRCSLQVMAKLVYID